MQRFKKWLDNYWYHYKWHTIIGAFFALVLTLLLVQCATKQVKEFQILYAGPVVMGQEQDAINDAFSSLTDEQVVLHSLWLYTEEQLQEVIQTPSTASAMASNRESLYTWTQAGENLVYLLDPYWFHQLKEMGLLRPVAEVLGQTPDSAIDEYGIRFHDTAFAKHYSTAFSALPADTILCVRTQPIYRFALGKGKEEQRYQKHMEYFSTIVKFGQTA